MENRWENVEIVTDFLFLGFKITADGACSYESWKWLLLGRKAMTNLESMLKSRDITLPTKVHIVKTMVFPVVKYGCESWTIKKAECQRIDTFKLWWRGKFLKSPLNSKEIKPLNLKGDQPWIFTDRTDVKASVFWSSDTNRQLIGKVSDAGRDSGQKEKRESEDEMAGWHPWCNERGCGQTPADGEGQGGLACCSSWGSKMSQHDWATEQQQHMHYVL